MSAPAARRSRRRPRCTRSRTRCRRARTPRPPCVIAKPVEHVVAHAHRDDRVARLVALDDHAERGRRAVELRSATVAGTHRSRGHPAAARRDGSRPRPSRHRRQPCASSFATSVSTSYCATSSSFWLRMHRIPAHLAVLVGLARRDLLRRELDADLVAGRDRRDEAQVLEAVVGEHRTRARGRRTARPPTRRAGSRARRGRGRTGSRPRPPRPCARRRCRR